MFARKRLFLFFLFFLTACSSVKHLPEASREISTNDPNDLVIVATTDFHAALDHAEILGKIIRDLKKKYANQMIYLDGGDLFQGSLEGNLNKGKSVVKMFNLIGLDAAAIGNHELDYGPDVIGRITPLPNEDGMGNLKARVKEANFKWLSVNLIYKKKRASAFKNALGKSTVFKPHAIFERAGKKVCVIGATTPTTVHITNPLFVREVEFEPLKETVQAEADFLRHKMSCDFVLLTMHAGLLCNESGRCLEDGTTAEAYHLLNDLEPGTLDALVAGHTHLRAQEIINGTPVIEAGANSNLVGVLKIKSHSSKKTEPVFEPFIEVPKPVKDTPFTFPETKDITEMLEKYRKAASNLKNRPVGVLDYDFNHTYQTEDPLGNLVVDAVFSAGKKALGTHFAIVNSGGIRGNLSKGPLTYGDVYKVLPFDNALAVADLTGAELRLVVEIAESGGHGVSPIAGLHVKKISPILRDLNHDGKSEDWERQAISDITDSDGTPIENEKMYRVATLDFLVHGGDHQSIVYDALPLGRKHFFDGVWVRDILVEFIKAHPHLKPEDYFNSENPRVLITE